MRAPRKLLLALALASWGFSSFADAEPAPDSRGAEEWVSKGLQAEARFEPLLALDCYRRADELSPGDSFVLQKIAQQLSDAAFVENDRAETERMLKEAFLFAQQAAELDPQSAVNRLSLAVLYGRLAEYCDMRTKVRYAQRVRDEAEAALELDETYAWAYHVLGKWHAEMSKIGEARRLLASLLFGGFSRPSLDTAIELLERAVELQPEAIAHHVELGFAYQADGQEELARCQWEKGLRLDSKRLYDPAAKTRAREALGVTEVGRLD